MKLARVLALVAGLAAPALAHADELFAPSYVCRAFADDGSLVASLHVDVLSSEDQSIDFDFDRKATPRVLRVRSSSAYVPGFVMPTSDAALIGGTFEVMSRMGKPDAKGIVAPPDMHAARTGVRLVFPAASAVNNGYVVVEKDGPSTNFEVAGFHPTAAGICVPQPPGSTK